MKNKSQRKDGHLWGREKRGIQEKSARWLGYTDHERSKLRAALIIPFGDS